MELKEALKEKYPGGVYEVNSIIPGGKVITFYLKDFDRSVYSACEKLIQHDELEAIKVALVNLWIGGEKIDAYLDEFKFLKGCQSAVKMLLQAEQVAIKKI